MRATSALGVHYPLIHPLAFCSQRGGERAGGPVRGRRERRDRRRHNWAPLRRWRCLCLKLETNAQVKMCSTFWATEASLSIELHARMRFSCAGVRVLLCGICRAGRIVFSVKEAPGARRQPKGQAAGDDSDVLAATWSRAARRRRGSYAWMPTT